MSGITVFSNRVRSLLCFVILSVFVRQYDRRYLRGCSCFAKPWRAGWRVAYCNYRLNKKQKTNLDAHFPVSHLNTVWNPWNIDCDIDSLRIFQGAGKYIQAFGHISIGKGVWVANNVAILTANHMVNNLSMHDTPKDVVIGNDCWIGINSVILPGVSLGEHTIVGAGSVVTHSFPDGYVVIAGNPAKIIRHLNVEQTDSIDSCGENIGPY